VNAKPDYDVAILGAGLVGMTLAVALSRCELRVALLERGTLAAFDGPVAAEDWDVRVYAVSPGSAEFLRGLGVWQRLAAERVEPIETMNVHGDGDGSIVFSAYELGERALAWIVENRALAAALAEGVRTLPGLDVRAPCEAEAIAWSADSARIALADGSALQARLVVGADGVRSWRGSCASRSPTDRRRSSPISRLRVRIAGAPFSGFSKARACWHGCRSLGSAYRWCGPRPMRWRASSLRSMRPR
jgi:2-polyprenyl-6-methoxyphenol hydroxylase-like FAD-dependent oxidoreductase